MATFGFKDGAYDSDKLCSLLNGCPMVDIDQLGKVNDPSLNQAALIKWFEEPTALTGQIVVAMQEGKYTALFNGDRMLRELKEGKVVQARLVSSIVLKRAKHQPRASQEQLAELRDQFARSRSFGSFNRNDYDIRR